MACCGDGSGVAITLNNIGRAYNTLGEKQKAPSNLQPGPFARAVGNGAW